MTTKARATIEDLYKAPGKAEIINGEVVLISPTGDAPNYAAGEIFVSLREQALVPFNSKRMGWRRFLPRISPAL
jgi:hypothetical protein